MARRVFAELSDLSVFVFLSAPFRLYDAGVRAGGAARWSFFAAYFGVCVGAGAVGAGVGVVTAHSVEDYFWGGFLVGTFVMLGWTLYAVVVLLLVSFWDLIPRTRAGRRDAWGTFVGLLHRRGAPRGRHRRGNPPG